MPIDADELEDLARKALANGSEESVLPRVATAAERSRNARLWQFAGLLQRALDRHSDALRSFTAAAQLAPGDPLIAGGLARVALEAGVDAIAPYERALRLDPANGAVLLGLVAAKLASGRGLEAEALLEAAVERSPLWIEGHAQLAQVRSVIGKRERTYESIERALADRPAEPALWAALLDLAVSQEDFATLDELAKRARTARLPETLVAPFEAVAAAELGQIERADLLLAAMAPESRRAIAVWETRHLLRAGRTEQAIGLIDRELASDRAADFWPYASLAWRLAGDPRSDWLERDGELAATVDLGDALPLHDLAALLRSLHAVSGEYLDQSVRGGSQTDGPLLSRIEPPIQMLRSAIVAAVEDYRSKLPPIDPSHPLLRQPRDRPVRFAGSWSVRLRGAGYHASHVHPQGWISSALYIALPDVEESADRQAGQLKLGEAPVDLGLQLPATRLIEPKPGRLALFPSWMWHGTVPFPAGERLTVAFDVKPPL